jgi:membrane-bound serine protease (ClpP class)
MRSRIQFTIATSLSLFFLASLSYICKAQDPLPSDPFEETDTNQGVVTESPAPETNLTQVEVESRVWVIRVPLPITSRSYDQIQRSAYRALDRSDESDDGDVLIFEFSVGPNQSDYGQGSEYGVCYQLADFLTGDRMRDVRTIAHLPQTVLGHAVLPVLACDEVMMASDAEIGEAGIDETHIAPAKAQAYRDMASRRRILPPALAVGLVDTEREVLRVRTDLGIEYVDRAGLAELQQRGLVVLGEPEVIIAANQPARFTAQEARRLGIATYLADDLDVIADALGLSPKALIRDPSLDAEWRPVRIDIQGPINPKTLDRFLQMLRDAREKRDANLICIWLDSPGGSLDTSLQIADALAYELDPFEVRSVAYIPRQALADAALIAIACDEIVMHPTARLGGVGDLLLSPENIESVSGAVRSSICPQKGRSWSIPVAMFDEELAVYEMSRAGTRGGREFFCEEERLEQSNPEEWRQGELKNDQGGPLLLTGDEAVECWIASETVNDFQGFKRRYGLENDPSLMEPGWADTLIRALASPYMAVILLLIGFCSLYIEMKVPGVGIGGFLATLCFILFFWSRFLGGTAGWLEALLLILGLTCLMLEFFVIPGFGIFGLGGGAMVVIAIVLACQTFIVPQNSYQMVQFRYSLSVLALSGMGTACLGYSFSRWVHNKNLPKPEEIQEQIERESLVDWEALLGRQGRTTTRLYPSGKAMVDGQLIDVMADCEMIPARTLVTVVLVQGNRVFVKPVE